MILNSLIDWYFVNNFYSIGLYDVISVTYERFLKFSLLILICQQMSTNCLKVQRLIHPFTSYFGE